MTQQRESLSLLSENETKLSHIYNVLSESLPEMSSFWRKLSQEEVMHAKWIDALGDKLDGGKLFFDEDRFNMNAIEIFRNRLTEELSFFENNNFDKIRALAFAVDIERSLIERKLFDCFETDSVELKALLETLSKSTEEHLRTVEEEMRVAKEEREGLS